MSLGVLIVLSCQGQCAHSMSIVVYTCRSDQIKFSRSLDTCACAHECQFACQALICGTQMTSLLDLAVFVIAKTAESKSDVICVSIARARRVCGFLVTHTASSRVLQGRSPIKKVPSGMHHFSLTITVLGSRMYLYLFLILKKVGGCAPRRVCLQYTTCAA